MSVKQNARKNNRGAAKDRVEVENVKESGNDLLIAAIGASAGGIEAFSELITHLPPNTGMAFVLIQQLDPKHHSLLAELLSKKNRHESERGHRRHGRRAGQRL